MKTYTYQGPDSGITLQDKDTSTDVLLRAGQTVRLPEGNAAVKTLAAQGYLVEVEDPHPSPLPQAGEGASKTAPAPTTKPKAAKE
jgi:hypothetical protein